MSIMYRKRFWTCTKRKKIFPALVVPAWLFVCSCPKIFDMAIGACPTSFAISQDLLWPYLWCKLQGEIRTDGCDEGQHGHVSLHNQLAFNHRKLQVTQGSPSSSAWAAMPRSTWLWISLQPGAPPSEDHILHLKACTSIHVAHQTCCTLLLH